MLIAAFCAVESFRALGEVFLGEVLLGEAALGVDFLGEAFLAMLRVTRRIVGGRLGGNF